MMTMRIRSAACALLFLLMPGALSAQPEQKPQLPDTRVGMAVRDFIGAVNSHDTSRVRAFVETYLGGRLFHVGPEPWSAQRYRSALTMLQKQAGTLEAVDIRREDMPGYLGVVFRAERTPKLLAAEFLLDTADGMLRSIEFHPMSMPAGPYQWPAGRLAPAAIAEALEHRIEQETSKGLFSGVVLVAKGDSILFRKAYGFSDAGRHMPNTVSTRFHSGSIGKMITAVAAAQLVERGLLRFTDTLGSILPDYPNHDAAASVTVHQLLTHTSGVADPFELGRRKPGAEYPKPSDNLPLFADAPLTMKPGSGHRYSNGNYAVLASIVERRSGTAFDEYLRDNIFIPAGMEIADTHAYASKPWAIGYRHDPELDPLGIDERTPNRTSLDTPRLETSGFSLGYMTADDIYRFMRALRSGALLPLPKVDTVTAGKVFVSAGAPAKYGYGFYDVSMWNTEMRGHSGGGSNSGIGADAEMVWKNDYYVVVLGNIDLDDIRPLSLSIVRFLGTQQ